MAVPYPEQHVHQRSAPCRRTSQNRLSRLRGHRRGRSPFLCNADLIELFEWSEQEFLDKLLREDLDRALATLPEHHRIVVILSDLEEFTYAEIASTLDVPIGTVRSRLARARSALQKLLWQQAKDYGLDGAAATGRDGKPRPDADEPNAAPSPRKL